MCAKCEQLENAVQRYRQLLALGRDALSLEVQRCRKLTALGVDPITIGLINAAIEKLVQGNAPTEVRAALWVGTDLSSRRRDADAGHLARLVH